MAQKQTKAQVVLTGKVDNSFGEIGTALTEIGGYVDEVSRKLIDFGKESMEVYRGYEDSMLDAQGALATTYGKGTAQLKQVMKELDTQATEWAASTIFHTDDVANAIAEAANANWNLEMILDGIPAAMRLAQAGGLDLSASVDYIIKSVNAAGISFQDMESWIDEWSYAAKRSAGTIEQFGEAMLRMGSTMKFADNREELLTLLATLHSAGTTGASAGTLLRNALIRLVAPTQKATDAMKALGISQEEVDEAFEELDEGAIDTSEALKEIGFSAYDEKGNLKDFITLFEELNTLTKDMSEERRNKILSAIFPTRSITGALALLDAAETGWGGLYKALTGGEAEGYGKYLSETMMSGVTGAVETFTSKVERLQQVVGGNMADQLNSITANFGKLIDKIAAGGQDNNVSAGLSLVTSFSEMVGKLADDMGDWSPEAFSGVMEGLGVLAGSGVGLLGAGTAFRLISNAIGATPVAKYALAAIGIASVAAAVAKFVEATSEANFRDAFGTMELDTTVLDEKMAAIQKDFKDTAKEVEAYATALATSVENYEKAKSTFSSSLLSDLLQGDALTEEEKEAKLQEYQKLGSDMVTAVKQGVTDSTDMSSEFWYALFRGKGQTQDEVDSNPVFQAFMKTLSEEKGEAISEAEAIGEQLQAAINSAWADGELSEEEYENIRSYFKDLNKKIVEAQREAQNEQDFINRKKLLDRASGLSYESMDRYIQENITPQRQTELDWWEENFQSEIYRMEYRRDEALKKGDVKKAHDLDKLIFNAREQYGAKRSEIYGNYDQMILDLYGALVSGTVVEDLMESMSDVLPWIQSGEISNEQAWGYLTSRAGIDTSARATAGRLFSEEVKSLGGEEQIQQQIAMYEGNGNTQTAQWLKNILTLNELLNTYGNMDDLNAGQALAGRDWTAQDFFAKIGQGWVEGTGIGGFMEALASAGLNEDQQLDRFYAMTEQERTFLTRMSEMAGKEYDLQRLIRQLDLKGIDANLQDEYAAWILAGMSEEERRQWLPYKEMTIEEHSRYMFGTKPVETEITVANAQEAAEAAIVTMQAEFGANPIAVTFSFPGLRNSGRTGNEGAFSIGSGASDGPEIMFQAEGGRATRPSIFAEAGIPEWYIPEEHTSNTARLILAAAAASGFGFLDLAEMAGARLFAGGGTDGDSGLNWGSLGGDSGGSGGGSVIQIEYAPVIHADNAEGVGRKLAEDKKRLKKVLEDLLEERELYESMVAYQ